MIKVLTLFLFLLFSLDSYAQNTIHGKTTDENGNSIPGVNVYIKDAYDGAISDSTGKFTFKTSSEGPVTLIDLLLVTSLPSSILISTRIILKLISS